MAARHPGNRSPNIADRYATMLKPLSPRQRLGVIAALSVGFYDGWRPTEAELAAYVATKFGIEVTGRIAGSVLAAAMSSGAPGRVAVVPPLPP